MKDNLFEMICDVCAAAIDQCKAAGCNYESLCQKAEYLVTTATLTYIEIGHEFAGERVYIPRKPRDRDQDIRDSFRGNNVGEIAEKFGVNRATVYRVIKRKKKEPDLDIITIIVTGVLRRNDCASLEKYEYSNAGLIYEKFATSKTLSPYLNTKR